MIFPYCFEIDSETALQYNSISPFISHSVIYILGGPIASSIPQVYNYVRKYVFLVQHHMYSLAMGAVTCAVCPESAWLVTFLIGNVSTGVVTWRALRCGASGESGKKVAAAPLSKTAAAAAAAKT